MLININKMARLMIFVQVLLIWSYLFLNISNFGDGVEIRLLAIFFALGLGTIFLKYRARLPGIKINFLVFLAVALWIAFRYAVDKNNYSDLIGVTIGTTGGVMLFYLMGLVLRECLEIRIADYRLGFAVLLMCYLFLSGLLVIDFSSQVRQDIFYIDNASDDYQRPGNFMSISFLIFSYIYVLAGSASHIRGGKPVGRLVFWAVYTASVIALLLSAQAIGSNSATAVISAIYIISISFVFEMGNEGVRRLVRGEKISGSELLKMLRAILTGSVLWGMALLAGGILFCFLLDINIATTRLFGFGEGGNSSIDSRMEILWRWGVEQISYAPFLGNVDVAYRVTGDEGNTLHNFLPDIWASLGLVGLAMIISLLYLIGHQLYSSVTNWRGDITLPSILSRAGSFYSIFVVAFIFLFANVSAGFSWAVLWFALGLFSKSLSSRRRGNRSSNPIGQA